MRTRIGNPSNEAHGKLMRVYDWIAPVGADPHTAMLAAETALGVKLQGATGEAHGFVNTSRREDGALYVSVHLYDTPCNDTTCPGGHGPVALHVAPDITTKLTAMKSAIGEHPQHQLRGTLADALVLERLGFKPTDAPQKA